MRWMTVLCSSMLLLLLIVGSGCYALRPSSGGGQTTFERARLIEPDDVAVPPGFSVEAVAHGLTFPTGATFDEDGNLYVVESGYSYGEVWTRPKLLKIGRGGSVETIAAGEKEDGPWTGVAYNEGSFYVADGSVLKGGRILKIAKIGEISTIVDELPSYGDHHTDGPVIGPDGWIYFGQGTASNSGVVGKDNYDFGWLKRHPSFHDIPGADIRLAGANFSTPNFLNRKREWVKTGGFKPFGTPSGRGDVIRGQVKCSGAVFRVRPDGSDLQRIGWGFRNPFGLAFSPDGELYVTDNGFDDRGSRPIWGAADALWKVTQAGTWYGWPDFSAGEPVTMNKFKPPGKPQPRFLLTEHPNLPPQPVARFAVHGSADGLDFSRNEQFGYVGQAFVALLGDEAPTTGKTLHPVGYKVVRVDVQRGTIEDFAVNKGKKNGPASKIGGGGLERPVAVRFSPSGRELYIVDFGVMLQDKNGAKPQPGTGVVWRIKRNVSGGGPR